MQIICGARTPCGFRVHGDYYREKRRFSPGICARCNGPIIFVDDYTENVVPNARMLLAGPSSGQLVIDP